MGVLSIIASGSFKPGHKTFSAMEHGHSHAVSEAIEFLAKEVLPAAIEQDHKLQEENCFPIKGFSRPQSSQ